MESCTLTTDELSTPIKYGVSKYKNIMGITCYMNSILHILQQTPVFVEYISQAKFNSSIIKKITLDSNDQIDESKEDKLKEFVIFELFRLFKTSLENDDSTITPTTFKNLIGTKNDMWNEYNHQDSQEFFNFLISQLEEEVGTKTKFISGGLNYHKTSDDLTLSESIQNIIATNSWMKFQSREYSPLKNLFDGLSTNNKRCMCCNSTNITFEPFLTLPITIPIKNKSDLIKSYSLDECLDYMVSEEQFDSDNKMDCDMCGLKNKSYSKTLLWKTPKVLVFHIKRFGAQKQKLTNNIIYPITNLDLSKYFNPASPYKNLSKYDLFGVNLHQSFGGINSGHYTSMVKNMMNYNWYLYNDSNPLKHITTAKQLQNSNAYLLFYYRRD